MKKYKLKLIQLFQNIRFRERMLLIYIIGGIIPFIIATLYLNYRSRDIILEQNKTAQQEEISLICSGIRESMNVAEDVAVQIYSDSKVQEIVSRISTKDYKNEKAFEKDCRELRFIDKYKEYYKNEIADIKIYVSNKTISTNSYFKYIGNEDVKKLRWYIPTIEKDGKNHWAYSYDELETEKMLQLTRTIQGEDGDIIGVLAIRLSPEKTTEQIVQRELNSILFYKENDVLASSFQMDRNYREVFKKLWDCEGRKGARTISREVKDYLVVYERIYPDDSGAYYLVATVQDYQTFMVNFYNSNVISVIVVIIGLFISVGLIVLFSMIFGNRISKLRRQMHYVAIGEYEKVEPIEGKDEVALLYQELEQMITDIKNLTARVVEEQVQKEKLHTQQKEVEFKMLASQINPHFLYNTLETIRMKAKINKEFEIEELVKMLAKIMRRNIQVGDRMVTLQSEIELIENYLVIQNYRFGDHIHSEVIVDENVDTSIMVVPLIMQPFVENAFVHGLESKSSDGWLLVHVMQTEEEIVIEISDNGVGIPYFKLGKMRKSLREGSTSEKGHIGINNVNQRLQILYGEEYGVRIKSEQDKGTCITIHFPVHTEVLKNR